MKSVFKKSKIVGNDYKKQYKRYWDLIKQNGFQIDFVSADARKTPFNKGFFDIVIMWGVLEHIGEEKKGKSDSKERINGANKCVREIHRVLKPGGLLVINYLPNKYSYIEFISKYLSRLIKIHHHIKKYNKKEIALLLKNNDFRITYIKRVHFIPSLYYHLGNTIGNLFNKNIDFLNYIDNLILKTPLKFFAQDFEIIAKKR